MQCCNFARRWQARAMQPYSSWCRLGGVKVIQPCSPAILCAERALKHGQHVLHVASGATLAEHAACGSGALDRMWATCGTLPDQACMLTLVWYGLALEPVLRASPAWVLHVASALACSPAPCGTCSSRSSQCVKLAPHITCSGAGSIQDLQAEF